MALEQPLAVERVVTFKPTIGNIEKALNLSMLLFNETFLHACNYGGNKFYSVYFPLEKDKRKEFCEDWGLAKTSHVNNNEVVTYVLSFDTSEEIIETIKEEPVITRRHISEAKKGDMVRYLGGVWSGEGHTVRGKKVESTSFKTGSIYIASHDYLKDRTTRCLIENRNEYGEIHIVADSNGRENGWLAALFELLTEEELKAINEIPTQPIASNTLTEMPF